MAKLKPEFDRRNVKIIGLSVDPTGEHERWAKDIEETQGYAPNYPIIADDAFKVSKLYGMLPGDVEGDPKARTPADNQTVRNVFVVGPDKKVKLILVYPMTTGRNFDEVLRVIDSLQLTAKHKVSTPVNWQDGDDVIIAGSVSNDEARRCGRTGGRNRARTSGSSPSRADVPIPLRNRHRSERSERKGPGWAGPSLFVAQHRARRVACGERGRAVSGISSTSQSLAKFSRRFPQVKRRNLRRLSSCFHK